MKKIHGLRGDDGYTLVELIVVLLLVVLIATAISAGMQLGTRVWERSESEISMAQTGDSAQTILRRLLASAIPRQEDGLARFHGESNYIAFDASPPAAFGASGVTRVEVTLVPGETGASLRVKLTSLIDGSKSKAVVLAERMGALRFAFLDGSGKVPAWLDVWRDRPHMPDAVRLTEIDGGGALRWPAFVARLPVAQQALCAFDPVSTDCRRQ